MRAVVEPSERFITAALKHAEACAQLAGLRGQLRAANRCDDHDDQGTTCLDRTDPGPESAQGQWYAYDDDTLRDLVCPNCMSRALLLRQMRPVRLRVGTARASLIRAYKACPVAVEG